MPKLPLDLAIQEIGDDDDVVFHLMKAPVESEPGEGEIPERAASIQAKKVLVAIFGKERAHACDIGSPQLDSAQGQKSKTNENDYEWDDIYSADTELTRGKNDDKGKESRQAGRVRSKVTGTGAKITKSRDGKTGDRATTRARRQRGGASKVADKDGPWAGRLRR